MGLDDDGIVLGHADRKVIQLPGTGRRLI